MFDLPSFDEIKTSVPERQQPAVKPKTLTTIKAVDMKKKIRVAGYCRVSTDMEEQKSSYEIQRQHCLSEVAKHEDWEFCGIYCDIVSGTKKEKRPELQRMLKACESHEINLILTKSISRFARNTTDLLEMVRSLTATGAAIIFDRERIDTRSMSSEFLLSILASLAEDESHSISSNCRWGMQKRFQDGSYKLSTAPYGYDVADGNLVINEDEAAVVREVFDRYAHGEGMMRISDDLNARDIPSKRAGEVQKDGTVVSGKWSAALISRMLHNEAYVGDFLMQKTFKDRKFNKRKNRGELDQYYCTDHHPAIISRETFEKAKQVCEKKWTHSSRKQVYPLTGLLTCGCCGASLRRNKGRTGSVTWICSRHRRRADDCPLKPVSEKELIETIREKLISGIPMMRAYRAELAEEWRKKNGGRLEEMESRISEINSSLSKLNGTGAYGADVQEKRNHLILEKVEIQRELERIRDNRITETEELLQLTKGWDGSSLDFIRKITVYENDLSIQLKCGMILQPQNEADMSA